MAWTTCCLSMNSDGDNDTDARSICNKIAFQPKADHQPMCVFSYDSMTFCSCNIDLHPMTLIYDVEELEASRSRLSKMRAWIRSTDKQTRLNVLPRRVVKNEYYTVPFVSNSVCCGDGEEMGITEADTWWDGEGRSNVGPYEVGRRVRQGQVFGLVLVVGWECIVVSVHYGTPV